MLLKDLKIFDVLNTPIWVVDPLKENIVYRNLASQAIAGAMSLSEMREGLLSSLPVEKLHYYLLDLRNTAEWFEIWTIASEQGLQSVRCKTTLIELEEVGMLILFEAIQLLAPEKISPETARRYQRRNNSFFSRFFMTNTAPMLLLDPDNDGKIVDANQAALRFYNYNADEMYNKYVWEINTLGKDVIPIMRNVANLPGGHKPLHFSHILSDGTIRHVQTYAGSVMLYNVRLMLCIIHDITEEILLKKELEFSASHDPLTGLLNRREFYSLIESPAYLEANYCLLLIDVDNFKAINDSYGHQKGDEVLFIISRLLESASQATNQIYRWGGEEFLLFLPDITLEAAMEVAENIRLTVSNYRMMGKVPMTVSIGVADRQCGEEIDQLFNRVDKALYAAKKEGRNKVRSWHAAPLNLSGTGEGG